MADNRANQNNLIEIGQRLYVGTFSYSAATLGQTPLTYVVQQAYPADLNGDGIDEVIFAGFETQPNSADQYTNTKVQIYGWKNGLFQNLTQEWLPGSLSGVEGVGDIAFGDFNGDGKIDVYLSANADMNYSTHEYVLLNSGTYFDRLDLGSSLWEHGVASGDINSDGYTDVVVFGYLHPSVFFLGGSSGLKKYTVSMSGSDYATFASGGVIGNFLQNGERQIVAVDSAIAGGPNDSILLKTISENGQILGFASISTLPTPLLDNPYSGANQSHDVRARALDFNHDGLDDVIVFSRAWWDGTKWPEKSAIQFLLNTGHGDFIDVTSSLIKNYEVNSNVSYVPVFKDLNNDGIVDIFVSEADWSGSNNSTAVLLSQPDGTYAEFGRALLSGLLSASGGMATLLIGPNGQTYLVTNDQAYGGLVSLGIVPLYFTNNKSPPTITTASSATTPENVSTSTAVYTATATDSDVNTTLNYSISGGADAVLFNINATTGTVTFKASPNFEAPADSGTDNIYDIVVQVSDGSLTATKAVAITITDVLETKLGIDFNGDFKSDILLQSASNGSCYVWQMNGLSLLPSSSNGHGYIGWTPGSYWQAKATGDFNGDGKSDILLQNSTDGACYVWELNGTGPLVGNGYVGWTPGKDWVAKGAGDFNGDGKSDVLLQNSTDGSCYIWELNGTGPLVGNGYVGWSPGTHWQAKGTGDFNGDGKSDILLQDSTDGACYIWELNGTGPLVGYGYVGWTPGKDWVAKGAGDFNGDGRSDVLLQNSTDGSCYIWELDGTGPLVASGYVGWTPGKVWDAKGTGDYNGDGKSDILLQNATDGSCYVWELSGTAPLVGNGYVGWIPGADWHAVA